MEVDGKRKRFCMIGGPWGAAWVELPSIPENWCSSNSTYNQPKWTKGIKTLKQAWFHSKFWVKEVMWKIHISAQIQYTPIRMLHTKKKKGNHLPIQQQAHANKYVNPDNVTAFGLRAGCPRYATMAYWLFWIKVTSETAIGRWRGWIKKILWCLSFPYPAEMGK